MLIYQIKIFPAQKTITVHNYDNNNINNTMDGGGRGPDHK